MSSFVKMSGKRSYIPASGCSPPLQPCHSPNPLASPLTLSGGGHPKGRGISDTIGLSELQISSEQKRSPTVGISGTRSWLNGLSLCSSGNKDLDSILGGGLSVGSILLVKEDRHTTYHQVIAKGFVAEGIGHGHSVHCLTGESDNHFAISSSGSFPGIPH
eukprot:420482_1